MTANPPVQWLPAAGTGNPPAEWRYPVHWLNPATTLRDVACGLPNVNLVNTTQPGDVTCDPCKDTPAWQAAS